MTEFHRRKGDTYPTKINVQLREQLGAADLRESALVEVKLDDGDWKRATMINPARGVVEIPIPEVGEHTVDFRVTWLYEDGPQPSVQHFPSDGPLDFNVTEHE